ncbi:hypothetical protein U2U59_000578 [Salmonella enterica]|nr:hypothetical protein [Salmonella enterica]
MLALLFEGSKYERSGFWCYRYDFFAAFVGISKGIQSDWPVIKYRVKLIDGNAVSFFEVNGEIFTQIETDFLNRQGDGIYHFAGDKGGNAYITYRLINGKVWFWLSDNKDLDGVPIKFTREKN